jgi:hypothetical protein
MINDGSYECKDCSTTIDSGILLTENRKIEAGQQQKQNRINNQNVNVAMTFCFFLYSISQCQIPPCSIYQ